MDDERFDALVMKADAVEGPIVIRGDNVEILTPNRVGPAGILVIPPGMRWDQPPPEDQALGPIEVPERPNEEFTGTGPGRWPWSYACCVHCTDRRGGVHNSTPNGHSEPCYRCGRRVL